MKEEMNGGGMKLGRKARVKEGRNEKGRNKAGKKGGSE